MFSLLALRIVVLLCLLALCINVLLQCWAPALLRVWTSTARKQQRVCCTGRRLADHAAACLPRSAQRRGTMGSFAPRQAPPGWLAALFGRGSGASARSGVTARA